jgi:hypothetical protein
MRRGSVRPLVIVLALFITAGVAVAMAVRAQMPQGTDLEQVRELLIRGESAVERREIGEIMRLISPDYKDSNGFRRDTVRFMIGRNLREAESVEVTIPDRSLQIQVAPDGENATASFDVSVTVTPRGGGAIPHDARMSLQLRKEPSRIWGVFPTHAWRIIRADGYGAMGDLAM